jgi:hypothetical protein
MGIQCLLLMKRKLVNLQLIEFIVLKKAIHTAEAEKIVTKHANRKKTANSKQEKKMAATKIGEDQLNQGFLPF